jgi:hypothetical protein
VPVTVQALSKGCWQLDQPPSFVHQSNPVCIPVTFHDYVAQLPPWEHHLFADLQLQYDPYEIMQLINLHGLTLADALFAPMTADNDGAPPPLHPNWHLHMGSDGSELAQHMTFGWALCLNDGTRLAFPSGPAFGKGSSHRAEATSMLSGARFLYHLTQYCAQPINHPTIFTTDNKGLLTHILQRNGYAANFATATLAPNWDLVEDLHRALSHFKIPPEFAHVKGHQDDKKSYDKPTLTAQLNVDADHEAGNFQWNHAPTLCNQAPLSPHTHAQLNIAGRTISSHYRHNIRTAASQDAFFAKCREIHEWTPSVFQLIYLPTLQLAVRHSCSHSIFTFKFLHGLLPTQATKSVWYCNNPRCPECPEDDTQIHFMQCMHPVA